jgi:CRP/FNR family transcriptional regulator
MEINMLSRLPFRNPALLDAISANGSIVTVPEGTQLVTEGQQIRQIPFILTGSVRVFASHDARELFLYNIHAAESCIMSLAISLRNENARINAITDEDSEILLLPVQRVQEWLNEFPEFNMMFYSEFHKRYSDLVDTLQQLVFNNLEGRLLDYLKDQKSKFSDGIIDLRHRQIASDLGTAREVISRILKKLEKNGSIIQTKKGIEIK